MFDGLGKNLLRPSPTLFNNGSTLCWYVEKLISDYDCGERCLLPGAASSSFYAERAVACGGGETWS